MKEIGGYFEMERNFGMEYHTNCISLNSGRNGLRYLIRARGIRCIYLPRLLCSVISDICIEEDVEIVYYCVRKDLKLDIPERIKEKAWVYIINYYGQYNREYLKEQIEKYQQVIIDNAQAFFCRPISGIDTIYTCRKFFGVSDGAYLYTTAPFMRTEIEVDCSFDRLNFLMGRLEKSASEFYEDFQKNEELIGQQKLKYMSYGTHNMLRGIDYQRVKELRNKNFEKLHSSLKPINELIVHFPEGSFMYPLLIENGEKYRKFLREMKIYIPLLWPNVLMEQEHDSMESYLAKNILPLPCDQRYSIEDMDYMAEIILNLRDEQNYMI